MKILYTSEEYNRIYGKDVKMAGFYSDELRQARKEEDSAWRDYNIARQQRADWEHTRAERAQDPQYNRQDYENDNVTSHERGQREVEARNRFENAQTKRMEIEKKQNENSRENTHENDRSQQNTNSREDEKQKDDNKKDDNEQQKKQQEHKKNMDRER